MDSKKSVVKSGSADCPAAWAVHLLKERFPVTLEIVEGVSESALEVEGSTAISGDLK